MLLFFLIALLTPCIFCLPKRWSYNCNSMSAQLFQVPKAAAITGQKSYRFIGKTYNNMINSLPSYDKKILEVQMKLFGSVPSDEEEATPQFLDFRKQLYGRDYIENYVVDKDQEFEEKMKLSEFAKIVHKDNMVLDSFDFLKADTPYDWLDGAYSIFNKFIAFGLELNYKKANQLRKAKDSKMTDYCHNLAQSLKTDPDWTRGTAKNALNLVFRCYDIFPFSYDSSDQIFDTALLMIKFYVFNSFSSDGLGMDTLLRNVKEQRLLFDSNFRFMQYIIATLNRLNDAHLSTKVDCYEQFTFIQPLNFQNYYEQSVRATKITKVNNPVLQEWVNSEILLIDGSKQDKTIADQMEFFGKSHSFYTRCLLGLSRLFFDSPSGDFRLDRGFFLKRTIVPNREYVIYSLKKPDSDYVYEISVNWLVFTNPGLIEFDNQYQYWGRNCEAKPFAKVAKKTPDTTLLRRDVQQAKAIKLKKRTENGLIKRGQNDYAVTSDGTLPISIGPGFAFFIMNNVHKGKYGVLIIQTFDVTDMDCWFSNMQKGFLKLIDNGIKKLVLDLTGNSGGVLCLAYSLLGVLSPSKVYPFPATKNIYGTRTSPTDTLVKISKCATEAGVKVTPFKIQSFTNLTSRMDFPADASWESDSEVKPKIMNGFQMGYSRFSPFVMDKCVLKQTPLLANVKPDFDTIILVTDGLCGSSCAVVATYIQQSNSSTILFASGTPGQSIPNAYSFAGGQVVNLNNVKDIAKRSSCFDIIPSTLERVQITVTYRAIFNLEDKNVPLEYYIMPAHWRISHDETTITSFAKRWQLVFEKGLELSKNIAAYTYDPAERGKVVGYSQ